MADTSSNAAERAAAPSAKPDARARWARRVGQSQEPPRLPASGLGDWAAL